MRSVQVGREYAITYALDIPINLSIVTVLLLYRRTSFLRVSSYQLRTGYTGFAVPFVTLLCLHKLFIILAEGTFEESFKLTPLPISLLLHGRLRRAEFRAAEAAWGVCTPGLRCRRTSKEGSGKVYYVVCPMLSTL